MAGEASEARVQTDHSDRAPVRVEADGSWASVAAAYLAEARACGSDRTAIEYGRVLARWLHSFPDPHLATTAQVYAFTYGRGPSGREPSPSTITLRLAAVSGLYDFARRMGLVQRNPADEIKRPRARPPIPRGLTPEQLRQLLAALPRGVAEPEAYRAIIVLMIYTGLRRSEALGLTADSLQDGGRLLVWRAKGGHIRKRELPAPALQAMHVYFDVAGHRPNGADRLFAVSTQAFYRALARYGSAALGHPIHPHQLRHTCAQLRREAGESLEAIQALLGHANLATTSRYLTRLMGQEDTGWSAVAGLLGL